ncbi:MAG: low-specificity L-threonine aldolase [Gammaproteobacteria bacterium]|nr:low-specificity L-threonine aldolase [Gammaproteobacteria bacterium]
MNPSNQICDLRSDTVTRPTEAMRAAMANADVGDDVYGEDPTVNALEKHAAELLGKEAALFVSSGTQGNLLALLSHCERGEEYIVGQNAHAYRYEAGGAAVLGSIQPQPIDLEADGSLDLDRVRQVIKPENFHFARTKLLCLENTQGGKVLSLDYLAQARAFCDDNGLGLHLDGARLFNASVKLDVPVHKVCEPFDSISFCLSKGLGAPVGSILCANQALIDKARRMRKMLGGGMRQAGILAAAGRVALDNHVARLAEDHDNAARLAQGLSEIPGLGVDLESVQTNMVFVHVDAASEAALLAHLSEHGVLASGGSPMRLVTHLDVSRSDVERAIEVFAAFASA